MSVAAALPGRNNLELLQQAAAQLNGGQPAAALLACEQVLASAPAERNACWIAAHALMRLKRWAEAVPLLANLQKLDPQRADVAACRIECLLEMGSDEEAMKLAQQWQAQGAATDPRLLQLQALALRIGRQELPPLAQQRAFDDCLTRRRFQRLFDELPALMTRFPTWAGGPALMGAALYAALSPRFAECLERHEAALRAGHASEAAQADPGRIERLDEARALLRLALRLDPSLSDATDMLRRVEFELHCRRGQMPPEGAVLVGGEACRPSSSLSAYVRTRGLDALALRPSEIVQVPVPRSFGASFAPLPQPQTVSVGPAFAVALPQAVFRARSAVVITADGMVIHETLAHPLGDMVELASEPGLEAHAPGWILLNAQGWRQAEVGVAAPLTGVASREYGHWLFDYLPRLEALMRHSAWPQCTVFVDAVMPASHLESLRLLIGDRPVAAIPEGVQVRAEQLLLAPPPVFFPYWCRPGADGRNHVAPSALASFDFLRAGIFAALQLPAKAVTDDGRRIFLRRHSGTRRLLNQDRVEAHLVRHWGFEAYSPETLGFSDQVRLLHGARCVVGAVGSALSTAVFCRSGASLIGLCPGHAGNQPAWAAALAQFGIEHLFVVGAAQAGAVGHEHHSDYDVPLDTIDEALHAAGLQRHEH